MNFCSKHQLTIGCASCLSDELTAANARIAELEARLRKIEEILK